MQSYEYRCELRNRALATSLLRRLGARPVGSSCFTDSHISMPTGTLKKRESPSEPTDWVFYHRKEQAAPNTVHFSIMADSTAQERYRTERLVPEFIVQKERLSWLAGQVNIHFDTVRAVTGSHNTQAINDEQTIGEFLKIDTLVTRWHTLTTSESEVAHYKHALWPALGEAVSKSYGSLARQLFLPGHEP